MHRHHPLIVYPRDDRRRHAVALTPGDHDRLQSMMCTMIGAATPLASLLRHKLGAAVVVPATALGRDVASSGRRVRYKIDGLRSEERTLSWTMDDRADMLELPLGRSRGMALLGLRVGQAISYVTSAHRTEFIEIEAVLAGTDQTSGIEEIADLPAGLEPHAFGTETLSA